jgi:threonine/homoserine/homoserine lactone efflux protein
MGGAIGQSLPMAIGIALSPFPIIAVVLILATPKARSNGPAFIIGWLLGLEAIGVIMLVFVGPSETGSEGQQAAWVDWLKLMLGVLLLPVAVQALRRRTRGGEEAPMPKWMGAVDHFTPLTSTGAGAVLAAANPKNLILAVGGAAAIAQTGIAGGQQALAYAIFTLIATIGVGAPVVIYFALGTRSREVLDKLKGWMGRNNAVIMAVLCLVIGVKLIGDAISGFSA